MATAPVLEKEIRVTTKRATETMNALVFRAPHQIGIEQVPIPKPGYGEVVIKVSLTTICGTDLHILRGEYPVRSGLIIGHEAVGRIHEIGPGVTGYSVGDRVLVGAITPCGQCEFCLNGHLAQCGGAIGALALWQHDQWRSSRISARSICPGQPCQNSVRTEG